jgi:hypothetical protein
MVVVDDAKFMQMRFCGILSRTINPLDWIILTRAEASGANRIRSSFVELSRVMAVGYTPASCIVAEASFLGGVIVVSASGRKAGRAMSRHMSGVLDVLQGK